MVDLEASQISQEPSKSSEKEPERAPKRLQNHFWIENADFSKMLIFLKKIIIFEGGRVSLGAQNRPQEAPRRDKKTTSKEEDRKSTKRRPSRATKRASKSFDTV